MKVKVLAKADESMRLLLEETQPSYANALRRGLLSDVPQMAVEGAGVVTSADLEPIGDAKLRPKDSKIPIVKLGDGQAMLIYATAVLGSGKEHAKWQSTHGVGYRYYPILKAGSKTLDALDPNVPFCESHMQSTSTEEEETLELSSDCETCKKFMEQYKVEYVKAANDPTRIVMEFETDGSLSAKAVLLASLDILAKRFSELATQAARLA